MLQIQTIGYVGNNAKTQEYDGKKVVNFSVAHTEKIKLKNGQEQEKTTWIDCSYWTSTNVAEFIKKGTQLFILGQMFVSMYDKPSGEKEVRIDCRIIRLEFINQPKDK